MAVLLKADNRSLTTGARSSYLSTNYVSGVSSIVLTNVGGFTVDQYVLLGNFGSGAAEVARVATVTAATNTITLKDDSGGALTTKFAHSESTKVTILPYNQIRFYWTSTATFGTGTPITSQTDLTASDWFSTASDTTHTTGYGWFVYYNVANSTNSTNSSAIPFGGFNETNLISTVKGVFSLMNNKELKLVTREEVLGWINEAYSTIRNNLNLVNHEYFVSDKQTVPVVAGTSEYLLPTDFSDIIVVWSGTTFATSLASPEIPFIDLHDVNLYQGLEIRYYIRGAYIGFVPAPTGTDTIYYRYTKKATALTLDSDILDLPDNAVYTIKDFVLYRVYQKLSSPQSTAFLKAFSDGMNAMKIFSIKRDGADDSWKVHPKANV